MTPAPSRSADRSAETVSSPGRRLFMVPLAIGFVVCGLMSLLVGQDCNWDLRNYHYYNPHAFLNDRLGYDVAPAQRQTYLNPFLDLPFYFGTRHLPPKLLGFLMGGIQGLSLGIVFALCMRVFRGVPFKARIALAALCSAAGLYAPVFLGELGASQNDTLVSVVVLTSLLILVRPLATDSSLAGRKARTTLIAAALLLGLGTGLKATVMPHVVAFAAAALVVEDTWRKRICVLAIGGGAFLLGFLVANGYWMLRLWKEFENPFFPYYNNIFKSPWADPRSYADRSMLPTTAWEALTRPFSFCVRSEYTDQQNHFRDIRYAVLYVVLVPYAVAWLVRRVVAWRKRRRRLPPALPADSLFLLVFFVISFAAWEAMFSIIRYAAVMEPLAPLLIVVVAGELIGRRAGPTVAVAAATLVLMLTSVKPIQHDRVQWGPTFWEVEVPSLPNPEHSLVIMANTRPWAYLIPFFPPEVRWIGVDNNMTLPPAKTRMQAEIRRIIREHTGDMYLISRAPPSGWYHHDQMALASYGLRVESGVGLPIQSKHSRPGLHLWRLRRE